MPGSPLLVVTREAGVNSVAAMGLPDTVVVREVPATQTTFRDPSEVRSDIQSLADRGPFATLVVTSVRAADYVDLVREALADDADVATVGAACAAMLDSHGYTVTHLSSTSAGELGTQITRGPALILGAADMRPELPAALTQGALSFEHVWCYQTHPVTLSDADRELLARATYLHVAAPSAWRVVASAVLPETVVLVPGVTTRDEVMRGHANVVIARTSEIGAVITAREESDSGARA